MKMEEFEEKNFPPPAEDLPYVDRPTLEIMDKVFFRDTDEYYNRTPKEYMEEKWPIFTEKLMEHQMSLENQVTNPTNRIEHSPSFTPIPERKEESEPFYQFTKKPITSNISNLFSYTTRRKDISIQPKKRISTDLTRYLIPTQPEQNYWLEVNDSSEEMSEQINAEHLPIQCQDRHKHAGKHHSQKCSNSGHSRFCTQCFFSCPYCFYVSRDKCIRLSSVDIHI